MTWLVIDAVVIMLVCAALGALVAWLLAVAFVPTRADLGMAVRGSQSRSHSRASRRVLREGGRR